MKDLINELTKYVPYNEEEKMDKALFIRFLESFDDAFYRTNPIAHVTASSWILNETHDAVLMVYHNIFHSWSWTGGHADGDIDLLNVAMKEAKEETGIESLELAMPGIFSIESLTVDGHQKAGKYVASHLHLNVTYLFIAKSDSTLHIKTDENSNVAWIKIADLAENVEEKWMMEHIYRKLNQKVLAFFQKQQKNKA